MIRKRVLIEGVVQGVFFRDTCRKVAVEQGVAGWVHNLPDGRVEAVLEGEASAVGHVLAWASRGPAQAEVTAVDAHDEPVEGLSFFEIR